MRRRSQTPPCRADPRADLGVEERPAAAHHESLSIVARTACAASRRSECVSRLWLFERVLEPRSRRRSDRRLRRTSPYLDHPTEAIAASGLPPRPVRRGLLEREGGWSVETSCAEQGSINSRLGSWDRSLTRAGELYVEPVELETSVELAGRSRRVCG